MACHKQHGNAGCSDVHPCHRHRLPSQPLGAPCMSPCVLCPHMSPLQGAARAPILQMRRPRHRDLSKVTRLNPGVAERAPDSAGLCEPQASAVAPTLGSPSPRPQNGSPTGLFSTNLCEGLGSPPLPALVTWAVHLPLPWPRLLYLQDTGVGTEQ